MSGQPRVVAIIQARMGSTRLPGKTLMDLAGEPVIDHVIRRVLRARFVDDVIVAIPEGSADDVLARHLEAIDQTHVRGEAEDVLSRYRRAAEVSAADVVVRITADCPLIDPDVIDEVVSAFRDEPEVDYCANIIERTYPIGMDTEVFSRKALERADSEATDPEEREHVTPHLYRNPQKFRSRNVTAPAELTDPTMRLTVDEESDLRLLQELAAQLGVDASLGQYMDALGDDAELARLNAHVQHRHVSRSGD